MIAVFAPTNSFRRGQLRPEKMFKIIRDVQSIRGVYFTGIIVMPGWYHESVGRQDAYSELEIRQPELFKKQ